MDLARWMLMLILMRKGMRRKSKDGNACGLDFMQDELRFI